MKQGKRARLEARVYEGYLWDTADKPTSHERLQAAVHAVCPRYKLTQKTAVNASFYPYASLKSTIKIDKGVTRIKISDILEDAPTEVFEALIYILICRANRRQPRSDLQQLYDDYLLRPEIEEKHAHTRATRSRKQLLGTQGRVFNLDEIFNRVNKTYFGGNLTKPRLSWSARKSKRLLGYHDGHLNLVVISRWLDRKAVPPYVIDFIMYHELLHTIIPTPVRNGRRQIHSTEFKKREREFEQYEKASRWLSRPGVFFID